VVIPKWRVREAGGNAIACESGPCGDCPLNLYELEEALSTMFDTESKLSPLKTSLPLGDFAI
jgi:hypothetical protein